MVDIKSLQKKIGEFASKRDWDKFHDPKNLSMALVKEASELLEVFQWMTPEESWKIKDDQAPHGQTKKDVEDELADIFVYLVRIADLLNIDLNLAINEKMKANELKYPPEVCFGKATKYNRYK